MRVSPVRKVKWHQLSCHTNTNTNLPTIKSRIRQSSHYRSQIESLNHGRRPAAGPGHVHNEVGPNHTGG